MAEQNETVGTNGTSGTLFYMTFGIRQLGCGKKRKIPRISKKCYFSTHFPEIELKIKRLDRDAWGSGRAVAHPKVVGLTQLVSILSARRPSAAFGFPPFDFAQERRAESRRQDGEQSQTVTGVEGLTALGEVERSAQRGEGAQALRSILRRYSGSMPAGGLVYNGPDRWS